MGPHLVVRASPTGPRGSRPTGGPVGARSAPTAERQGTRWPTRSRWSASRPRPLAFLDANATLRRRAPACSGARDPTGWPSSPSAPRRRIRRSGRGPGLGPKGLRRRLRVDHRPSTAAGASRDHRRWTSSRPATRRREIVFGMGLGMVAPTILAHGTEKIKRRYLGAMFRGDIVGCQLFSEPGAGSDLAGWRTRPCATATSGSSTARRCGPPSPTWPTSARSSAGPTPTCPSTKGLTGFVIDMHAPGVEVRPLRQLTGGASFNEVFFTDVASPTTTARGGQQRLGRGPHHLDERTGGHRRGRRGRGLPA